MSLEPALQEAADRFARRQDDIHIGLDRRIETLEHRVAELIAALAAASDRATYKG